MNRKCKGDGDNDEFFLSVCCSVTHCYFPTFYQSIAIDEKE